jgi:hypothetical protein
MFNFYRPIIPQAAIIQALLHAALAGPNAKRSLPMDWTPNKVQAFEECKANLSRATLLTHPDPFSTLTLFTDTSDIAICVALQQCASDAWHPLAFYSHKLRPALQNYNPYRELLAVYEAIK